MGINKRDIKYFLAISLVTLVAWNWFLDHPIDHESFLYYYFQGKPYGENWLIKDGFGGGYENNFARVLFFVLIKIFKDNIYLQVLPFFLFITFVHLAFYIMVKTVLGRRKIALFSTLLMSVNYIGSFDMYNHSRYFFERIPQFAVVFLSFAFFVLYFKKRKAKYYFSSLGLFLLAVFMGHYATLFLPAFVFYALTSWLLSKKTFSRTVFLIIPFIVGSYFLIKDSPLGPSFFRQNKITSGSPPEVLKQVMYQYVGFTIPKDIVFYLSRNLFKKPSYKIAPLLLIPTVIFYAAALPYLYKRFPKNKALVLTSFLFIITLPFANVYLNRVNFINEIDGSRYFWVPQIFYFIILGTLVYSCFYKARKGKIFTYVFIGLWLISNSIWIYKGDRKVQWGYEGIAGTVSYVKKLSEDLGEIKYIGIPKPAQIGPLSFLDIYYVHSRAKMVPSEELIEHLEDYDTKEIIILGYNQSRDEFNKETFRIIDKKGYVLEKRRKMGDIPKESIYKLIYDHQ